MAGNSSFMQKFYYNGSALSVGDIIPKVNYEDWTGKSIQKEMGVKGVRLVSRGNSKPSIISETKHHKLKDYTG